MHSNTKMHDEETTLNRSYFTKTTSRMDAYIIKNHVIDTEDKHGERRSIEYDICYGLATKALVVKFGVSIHFILTVSEFEIGS